MGVFYSVVMHPKFTSLQRRLCAFCERHLTQGKNGTRALEHVFKESWILALGHQNTVIQLDHFRKSDLVRRSNRPAISFVAGDICNVCNGGWMNDIDTEIESALLGLARGDLAFEDLSAKEAFSLSRWLLKTAVTFTLSDSRDRRHLSGETLKRVPDPGFLPSGFVTFGFQYKTPIKSLVAATSDTIIDIDPGVTKRLGRFERIKFAIQYDRVILGCSFVACRNPKFIGLPGMHTPLYSADNNLLLDEELWPLFDELLPSTPFARQFINDFLLGLTFWWEATPPPAKTGG